MRSSTSSSKPDRRIVAGDWGRTLGLAALLVLLAVGGWEWLWLSRGAVPSVSDLQASWTVARDRVGPDSIVLLGTSKMQSAIDPRVLGDALGTASAIQLALIDRSPLPVLEHLAADEGFAGLVVIDIAGRIFFDASGGRERAAEAVLRADRTLRTSPGDRLNARLALLVESRFVFRLPQLSLRRLQVRWQTGRPLQVPIARVRRDRFRELDLGSVNLESRELNQALIISTRGRPATDDEVLGLAARVAAAAASIRRRGGDVVLVHLPTSGRALEAERQRFPRERYWDRLVESSAVAGVHSEDSPALAQYECRDGLHLERHQSPGYTEAFADVLRRTVEWRF